MTRDFVLPKPPAARRGWDEYFMDVARTVASRSTCPRKNVGCVIVKNNRILVTGYNGALPGAPHCDTAGCFMQDNHCIRTTHAEANAIAQAARHAVSLDGASAYVTTEPCTGCDKLLASAGIRYVVYGENYPSQKFSDIAYFKGT